MAKQSDRALHVCLDRESGRLFFAALENRRPGEANFRSSHPVEKGMILLMMPVPLEWDGEPIERAVLEKSSKAFEANVIRMEGRGAFKVRILSHDQQDVMARVRAGMISSDNLKFMLDEVGAIQALRLQGRIGLKSAAKIQGLLRSIPPDKRSMVLIDMSGILHFSKGSMGMFSAVIKEAIEDGYHIKILVQPDSVIEETLAHSKIPKFVGVYNDREEAVKALLMNSLT